MLIDSVAFPQENTIIAVLQKDNYSLFSMCTTFYHSQNKWFDLELKSPLVTLGITF